jgi:hypothetical protein
MERLWKALVELAADYARMVRQNPLVSFVIVFVSFASALTILTFPPQREKLPPEPPSPKSAAEIAVSHQWARCATLGGGSTYTDAERLRLWDCMRAAGYDLKTDSACGWEDPVPYGITLDVCFERKPTLRRWLRSLF